MTQQIRGLQHNISFQEDAAFNTKNGSFSSLRKFLGIWGWAPEQFKKGTIENQVTRADLGSNQPGVGLPCDNSTLNFSCYPQGVGVVGSTLGASDGETPVANAFTYLLEASLGGTAVVTDGTTIKAASTPTATEVKETDAGNHASNGIVAVEDVRSGAAYTGKLVARPYNTYATDTMTLLMALPAALVSAMAAGDTIFGGLQVTSTEIPTQTLQGDILGYRASHNFEFFGAIFNFSIGEVENGEAPVFSFEGKIGSYTRDIATSRTSVNSLRPVVLAGGEFILAKYGTTTVTYLQCLKFGFNLNRTWTKQSGQNIYGISGWVLTNQASELVLYVEDNATVPSGFTSTTYQQIFDDLALDENQFHYQMTLCGFPGRTIVMYLPHIHMSQEPVHTIMEDIGYLKLTFAISQGSNEIRMKQY